MDTIGYVDMYTKFGEDKRQQNVNIKYVIIDTDTSYNMLLGRPSLKWLGAIVSPPHLTMKFSTESGKIARVRINQKTAQEGYATSLKISPRKAMRTT